MSDTTRCPTCTAPVGEDGRWYPGEEMACGYDAGRAEEQAEAVRLRVSRDAWRWRFKAMEQSCLAALVDAGFCTPAEGFANLPQLVGTCIKRLKAELLDETNRGNDLGFRLATAEAAGLEQRLITAERVQEQRDNAMAEVERLRQMIAYALAGPDEDLPEPLGGRAVAGVKKVLRDALGAE